MVGLVIKVACEPRLDMGEGMGPTDIKGRAFRQREQPGRGSGLRVCKIARRPEEG